jgi:hypothetical protein
VASDLYRSKSVLLRMLIDFSFCGLDGLVILSQHIAKHVSACDSTLHTGAGLGVLFSLGANLAGRAGTLNTGASLASAWAWA